MINVQVITTLGSRKLEEEGAHIFVYMWDIHGNTSHRETTLCTSGSLTLITPGVIMSLVWGVFSACQWTFCDHVFGAEACDSHTHNPKCAMAALHCGLLRQAGPSIVMYFLLCRTLVPFLSFNKSSATYVDRGNAYFQ